MLMHRQYIVSVYS